MGAIFGLLAGPAGKAVLKLLAYLGTADSVDEQLRALAVDGSATVPLPDSAQPSFKSRSGKKFDVVSVTVTRRK
jgi:hypothetical protein